MEPSEDDVLQLLKYLAMMLVGSIAGFGLAWIRLDELRQAAGLCE
jgi:hypothetical protein